MLYPTRKEVTRKLQALQILVNMMETTTKKTKWHFILRNAGFVSLDKIIHTNEI